MENDNDDQYGDSSNPPEEPASEHQTRGMRQLLEEPEENQTDRNLEGDRASHQQEESMQDETDYEDI